MERHLLKSESQFREMFELSPDPAWIIEEGIFIECNIAALNTLGYKDKSDLIGSRPSTHSPALQPDGESSDYKEGRMIDIALRDGVNRFEWTHTKLDGSFLLVEVTLSRFCLNGRIMLYCMWRDITERNQTEAIRREIENTRIKNKMINQFLAHMSHEIRTPMNAIIGMTHLLKKTGLTAQQKNYVDKTGRSANVLLGVINDILDFSKIEAGMLEMELSEFSLDGVIEDIVSLLGLKSEESGVDLFIRTDPAIPNRVVGDRLRLSQVLINLCNNAIKFTDHGGSVTISITMQDPMVLLFSVEDTGIGISKEQIKSLFKPFSQGDVSTCRNYGGTGLGLTISKKLVEMMGGTIWLTSVLGKGSSFFFTIPFDEGHEQDIEKRSIVKELGTLDILVAGDNDASLEILEGMLNGMGFDCIKAVSSDTASSMFNTPYKGEAIDLMFGDWHKRNDDINECISNIRKDPTLCNTPLVLMANTSEETMVRDIVQRYDSVGIIARPTTSSRLLEVIVDVIKHDGSVKSNISSDTSRDSNVNVNIQGVRLLLVEDNKINQEIAQELLQEKGVVVFTAENGVDALSLLEKECVDGVLMDCHMPIMDGYETARKIREHKMYTDLPIIALTANVMISDINNAKAAGMNDHIAKPIDPNTLFATINEWMKPSSRLDEYSKINLQGKANESSSISLLDLPGIDPSIGLTYMMNNEKLYRRLLGKFTVNQEHFEHDFQTHIKNGDMESAITSAHTLKGTSANLGMTELRIAASDLEIACRENSDHLDDLFQITLLKLNTVFSSLRILS